jgi:hypothetical protein
VTKFFNGSRPGGPIIGSAQVLPPFQRVIAVCHQFVAGTSKPQRGPPRILTRADRRLNSVRSLSLDLNGNQPGSVAQLIGRSILRRLFKRLGARLCSRGVRPLRTLSDGAPARSRQRAVGMLGHGRSASSAWRWASSAPADNLAAECVQDDSEIAELLRQMHVGDVSPAAGCPRGSLA